MVNSTTEATKEDTKDDTKEPDVSTLIPVEATLANPDEVKREGNFASQPKPAQDDGTVFAPVIPDEEQSKKNATFAITPANLADMSSTPTKKVDQIAGVKEPISKKVLFEINFIQKSIIYTSVVHRRMISI